MGNLPFLPFENEEEIKKLYSDFSWLEEKGEKVNSNRLSCNFKLIDNQQKCCDFYRFFGGINLYLNSDNRSNQIHSFERVDSLHFNNEHCNTSMDETLLSNNLKYFPSLNGLKLNDMSIKSIGSTISEITSVIKMQIGLNTDLYPNIVLYKAVNENQNYIFLKRDLWESTIKDKLDDLITNIKELDTILKQWLAFQCLVSVAQLHSLGIFHGDLKTENMLINHIFNIKITDISPWKPIFIDSCDLKFWTIFFENQESCKRDFSKCYLSPERFLNERIIEEENLKMFMNNYNSDYLKKLFSMDIFSVGCIINEIEKNETVFTINEILKMSNNIRINKEVIKWTEILLEIDWKKRPEIITVLKMLLNMNKLIEINPYTNLYLFNDIENNDHYCRSFPLFFYPLSLILQNNVFYDVRIQLLILNIVLPIYLELLIIKDIYPAKEKFDNYSNSKGNSLYHIIFSSIVIEHKENWNSRKINKLFRNQFECELIKDLILSILIGNCNGKFNYLTVCKENCNGDTNNYSSIKGFFSIFQLLLNIWDNKTKNSTMNIELTDILVRIIMEDLNFENEYIPATKSFSDIEDFFNLDREGSFIKEISRSTMLYLFIILNCLHRLTHVYGNDLFVEDNFNTDSIRIDIYNTIYLLTMRTINTLLRTLPEEEKKQLVIYGVLPLICRYLITFEESNQVSKSNQAINQTSRPINIQNNSKNNSSFESYVNYHKEKLVVYELFRFINDNVIKYVVTKDQVLVENDANRIINNLILSKINKWIHLNVQLNNNQVVEVLLKILNKVFTITLCESNQYSEVSPWIFEILTSKNSALKLSILDSNKNYILYNVTKFFLNINGFDKFISELLPYLIDQLNDVCHMVRYKYCELIIDIFIDQRSIFLIPYGKFCIEKCLNDKDIRVKYIGLKSINKIIEKVALIDTSKHYISEYETVIYELVESLITFVKIDLVYIYYPVYCEIGKLLKNIFNYSIKYNNWFISFILLRKYFNIKQLNIGEISCLIHKSDIENEFYTFYFMRLTGISRPKNIDYQKLTANLDKIRNQLTKNFNINLLAVLSITNKFKIDENLDDIIYFSSIIQVETKYRSRRRAIHNLKTEFECNGHHEVSVQEKEFLPLIKGNYLGSIFSHAIAGNSKKAVLGSGFKIHQIMINNDNDLFSCSINNSLNAEVYLHKLVLNENSHYWSPITNRDNHIFKFNSNSYITCMTSLEDDLSIITGDSNGLLTKINLGFDFKLLNEYHYKDETSVFKESFISKNPIILLLGKLRINSKEMIMSIYSNGEVHIFDKEYITTRYFSIPPSLGKIIDFTLDDENNTNLACFITSENVIVVVHISYLKIIKIWNLCNNKQLKMTNINNTLKYGSSTILLSFNQFGLVLFFDWNSGKICGNQSAIFSAKEICVDNLINIYNPSLFVSKIMHSNTSSSTRECECLYCKTQRIRIFGNYLNQYLFGKKYTPDYKDMYFDRKNVIGPIYHSHQTHPINNYELYYLFNDNLGNIYQQNCTFSNENEVSVSLPCKCIINNYSYKEGTTSPGHKDIITSLNVYSFKDDIGLLVSSRDGTISYWN
ncbi:protein kinase [Cryptosporidium felis]|nr:protein kinase [Cryptosporidium felis]